MDRYEWLSVVGDIFDDCKTQAEMQARKEVMLKDIEAQYTAKLGFKIVMGELEH